MNLLPESKTREFPVEASGKMAHPRKYCLGENWFCIFPFLDPLGWKKRKKVGNSIGWRGYTSRVEPMEGWGWAAGAPELKFSVAGSALPKGTGPEERRWQGEGGWQSASYEGEGKEQEILPPRGEAEGGKAVAFGTLALSLEKTCPAGLSDSVTDQEKQGDGSSKK